MIMENKQQHYRKEGRVQCSRACCFVG